MQFKWLYALDYAPERDVVELCLSILERNDLHPQLRTFINDYYMPTWVCKEDGSPARYAISEWNCHNRFALLFNAGEGVFGIF